MVGVVDRSVEAAVDGVVLQHVSHVIRGDEVVDADDFNIRMIEARAEDETTYAAKTIDSDFDAHFATSSRKLISQCGLIIRLCTGILYIKRKRVTRVFWKVYLAFQYTSFLRAFRGLRS